MRIRGPRQPEAFGPPVSRAYRRANLGIRLQDRINGGKGSGGGVVQTYVGSAATRVRHMTGIRSGAKDINGYTTHIAASDFPTLKLRWGNYYQGATLPNEQTIGASITVGFALEYPLGTMVGQIPIGGSANAAVASGDDVLTDAIVTGIKKGDRFKIHWYATGASGTLSNPWRNSTNGPDAVPMDLYREGTTQGSLGDQSLQLVKTGGTLVDRSMPPIEIISSAATNASVLVIGDSIGYAVAVDTPNSTTAADSGLIGAVCGSFTDAMVFTNSSSGGLQAATWSTNWVKRKNLLADFSHFVIELGNNDVYQGAGGNNLHGAIKTNLEVITAAIIAARPDAKITICTVSGRTTAPTTGFGDTAGQVVTSGNTERDNVGTPGINNTIRALGINGQNNGYFDISSMLETSLGAAIWNVLSPRSITDGEIGAVTANTLNSPTQAVFSAADVGAGVAIQGAHSGGTIFSTSIASFVNSTRVLTKDAVQLTVGPGAGVTIGGTTNDGTHPNPSGFKLIKNAGTVDITRLASWP